MIDDVFGCVMEFLLPESQCDTVSGLGKVIEARRLSTVSKQWHRLLNNLPFVWDTVDLGEMVVLLSKVSPAAVALQNGRFVESVEHGVQLNQLIFRIFEEKHKFVRFLVSPFDCRLPIEILHACIQHFPQICCLCTPLLCGSVSPCSAWCHHENKELLMTFMNSVALHVQ